MNSKTEFQDIIKFQFHNGTINTKNGKIPSTWIDCFNSTTVQLIPGQQGQWMKIEEVFQFHNGTINTSRDWSFRATCESFNSTTVQLIL